MASDGAAKKEIKHADMTEDMQATALKLASQAFEKFQGGTVEKEVVSFVKSEFDAKYGGVWHCIVGKNFGSMITHETKHFIYFYYNSYGVLLFRTG